MVLIGAIASARSAVQVEAVDSQAVRPGRANTWAARSSTGRTVSGTWTISTQPSADTVTGTWTLDDANRKPMMRGGWSAAKSRTEWNGSWRAIVTGSKAEYSGTWSADVKLAGRADFADLFKKAVEAAVSGAWRAGRQSGTWSIRVFE
jgi:hypothetical protein